MPLSREQQRQALWRDIARIDEHLAEVARSITTSTDPVATQTAIEEKAALETKRAACVAAADALQAEIVAAEAEDRERRAAKWTEELQPKALQEITERADLVAHRLEAVADAYSSLVAAEERHKRTWTECGRPGSRAFPSAAKRSLCDFLGVELSRVPSSSYGPRVKRIHDALVRSALKLSRS